jgi:hypothetical protein
MAADQARGLRDYFERQGKTEEAASVVEDWPIVPVRGRRRRDRRSVCADGAEDESEGTLWIARRACRADARGRDSQGPRDRGRREVARVYDVKPTECDEDADGAEMANGGLVKLVLMVLAMSEGYIRPSSPTHARRLNVDPSRATRTVAQASAPSGYAASGMAATS